MYRTMESRVCIPAEDVGHLDTPTKPLLQRSASLDYQQRRQFIQLTHLGSSFSNSQDDEHTRGSHQHQLAHVAMPAVHAGPQVVLANDAEFVDPNTMSHARPCGRSRTNSGDGPRVPPQRQPRSQRPRNHSTGTRGRTKGRARKRLVSDDQDSASSLNSRSRCESADRSVSSVDDRESIDSEMRDVNKRAAKSGGAGSGQQSHAASQGQTKASGSQGGAAPLEHTTPERLEDILRGAGCSQEDRPGPCNCKKSRCLKL